MPEAFPDAVLARAGLILGPHEDIGRLPWWLARIDRGGDVLAPGRPDRPLQYVDARDLAAWMLDALVAGHGGPVDVISRSGHATTRTLLESCIAATGSDARSSGSKRKLAEAGVEPWTPIALLGTGIRRVRGVPGVRHLARRGHRPELSADHARPSPTPGSGCARAPAPEQRPDRPVHGIPADLEQRVLTGYLGRPEKFPARTSRRTPPRGFADWCRPVGKICALVRRSPVRTQR